MSRGQWHIESRNLAQKIAYVETACRSVLAAIEELEKASDPTEVKSALQALRTEFDFLNTLQT
jgi:hypothetical protein